MVIQDFFCNEILIKKRDNIVIYEDGIAKKNYVESTEVIKCRVSNLNYKDLQLIAKVDDMGESIKKLYLDPSVIIDPKDLVEREGDNYKVIAEYKPQDKYNVRYKKCFIKIVK